MYLGGNHITNVRGVLIEETKFDAFTLEFG